MFGDPNQAISEAKYTVADIADVQVGLVLKPTRFYSETETPYPAFRSLNIGPMEVRDSEWIYFTEKGMKENQRTIAHTGDVLVVRSGYPGTSCVVTPEYDGRNVVDLIIAHPNTEKILPEYLCAYTNFPHGKMQIEANQRGVAQKHFNVSLYNAMKIIVPDLAEQQEFINILKQSNKSKFIMFKSQFIEMFYGKGYPVKTIGDVIDKKISRVAKVFDKTEEIQYLDISSIDNSTKTVTGLTTYVLSEAPSRAQYVLKQDDIMYSTVRPNLQNIAINPYSDENVVGSTGFCVLRCIGVTTGYMWGVINSIPFTDSMINQASGANYPAVTDKVVHAYEIPIPPEEEQKAYEHLVRQSDKSK